MSHAVIVHLSLPEDAAGPTRERDALFELEDEIATAIERVDQGEFDGDLIGEGNCILYVYGRDADEVFAAIEPVLRSSPLAEGGYAIKRYGDVHDRNARETCVRW